MIHSIRTERVRVKPGRRGRFDNGQNPRDNLVALAVGLLLQGVLDPHGADWGAALQGSLHLQLQGIAKGDQP